MSSAVGDIGGRTRRLIGLQLLVGAVVAVAFLLFFGGGWQAVSSLCGSLVSVATALLLSRGVRRASEAALHDQKKSMLILYVGAVQRFVMIGALFALGIAVIKLEPLAMFTGFALAQLGYLMSARAQHANN